MFIERKDKQVVFEIIKSMAESVKEEKKQDTAVDLNEQRLPEIYKEIMKSYDILESTEESTNSDKNQVFSLVCVCLLFAGCND